jgi:multiple sugar transport system permease protein
MTATSLGRVSTARTRQARHRIRPGRIVLIGVLAAVGLVMVFPALWVLTTAFAPQDEIANGALIPAALSFYNFHYLLSVNPAQDPVVRWLLNSIGVSAVAAIAVAFIDSLAAFALARLQFRGSRFTFYLITSSLMIPFIAVLLPLYLEFSKVGLLNTYGALILPYTSNAFGVFLLFQFFKGIPQEIQDAAVADGASRFRLWRQIFLPLSAPVTVTLALITFMNVYNDFFWPLVATDSLNMRTITVGIEIVAVGQYTTNYTALMALTVISVIPMLIAFIFAQRRLVEGISFAAFQG